MQCRGEPRQTPGPATRGRPVPGSRESPPAPPAHRSERSRSLRGLQGLSQSWNELLTAQILVYGDDVSVATDQRQSGKEDNFELAHGRVSEPAARERVLPRHLPFPAKEFRDVTGGLVQ